MEWNDWLNFHPARSVISTSVKPTVSCRVDDTCVVDDFL